MFPIAMLLVVLEIIGLFIKSVILAVRLFGNIAAGHLVMAAVIALVPIAAGLTTYAVGGTVAVSLAALSLLELFVAFLQAYIFTFLTVLFIAQGAVHHHDDHGHEAHDGAHAH
jgi:F-type H+-transporting ATPase subunit a